MDYKEITRKLPKTATAGIRTVRHCRGCGRRKGMLEDWQVWCPKCRKGV